MGHKTCAFILILALGSGCAKQTLSERDSKLNQARATAETKRRELEAVVGEYSGTFASTSGPAQNVCLNLEIKEIPTPVEGITDQVSYPTLAGSFKYNLGDCRSNETSIIFAVEKSAYDASQKALSLVVNNSEYKEMKFSLKRGESGLSGTWESSTMGAQGLIHLTKNAPPPPAVLAGRYNGILKRGASRFQWAQMTVKTIAKAPDSLELKVSLKVIFGAMDSTEYLTYRFDQSRYNPITGILTIDGEDIVLQGGWAEGSITGRWSSKVGGAGDLGGFEFKPETDQIIPPANATLVGTLKGTYRGKLTGVPGGPSYPEDVEINVVTFQDLQKPNGLGVTGNLKFYEGSSFYNYPFKDVKFDSFTQRFIGEAADDTAASETGQKFTVDASVASGTMQGRLKSSLNGDAGAILLNKIQ